MALLLSLLLGVAFWAWVASYIGWKALLCVWGILLCLILLGTGDRPDS